MISKIYTTSLGAIAIASSVFFGAINNFAQAATLDFEGLPSTTLPTNTPNPASVLTDDFISQGVRFGKPGESAGVAVVKEGFGLGSGSGVNSIVALDKDGKIPPIVTGDMFFSFVQPGSLTAAVTDFVSFNIGDTGGDLDNYQIRVYDLADSLINTLNFSNTNRFPVSINLPGIHRLEIDFTGAFGYSLDDLTFNTPTNNNQSVPEPTSVLGLLALGGLGAATLKRKQSKQCA
ncbi:PEP-CTERM sorting domain-containing protein [Aerosakkonemataceae cyanobacterium BLCC-F50]|uniref:PEP-CTERM sorting domain-containing protein n=1 Tax=Floridaenema flaviceps BLCC-F50 TaxID=3153642 RepID=A0ABV4XHZ7_9CYAN